MAQGSLQEKTVSTLSLDAVAQKISGYRTPEALKQIDKLGLRELQPEYYYALRAETFVRDFNFSCALAEILKALHNAPDWAPAYNIQGNILTELGQFDDARLSFDRAVSLAPEVPEFRFNRAQLLFLLGDWQAAAQDYEGRLDSPLFQPHADIAAYPLWRGKIEQGKILLLYWEQGHGDTLQFIRFAHLLMAGGMDLVLEVQTNLTRLLAQSLPRARFIGASDALPIVDCRASIPSLPWLLGVTPNSLPGGAYLSAPTESNLQFANNPAIGLVWAGNPNHINDKQRSIPQEALLEITKLKRFGWYSLQVGASDKAKRALARAGVTDLTPGFTDFADTAAAVQALDLVITVDTSVAHLAGALGKPVWILLPFVPDWRWLLDRTDSPWYPTARLFRQPKRGDWASVLKEVKQALTEFQP